MKIYVAGFQHETNTFAPSPADWAAFQAGTTFPSCERGQLMALVERNLPIGGFMRAALADGHTLEQGGYRGATPSAHITRDAFERIAADITDHIAQAHERLDAIYLDLHGAAVAEHVDDCEAELLARVRRIVGPSLPVVISLDLHANVSEAMLELADAAVAYRKYPHTDMADTGALAFELLRRLMAAGQRPATAFARLPYLIPLNAQSTWMEPAKGVYEAVIAAGQKHDAITSFCPGFPAADVACCAPTLWAHAAGPAAAQAALAEMLLAADLPQQWQQTYLEPDAAVRRALDLAQKGDQPILIADTQDNPGAGGDANTTGMLHALLRQEAGRRWPGKVALGLLCDAAAAAKAHTVGVGGQLELSLGASVPTWGGAVSDAPLRAECTVMQLADGPVALKGEMSTNANVDMGLSACLDIQGVRIAVASKKKQMLDRELFRYVGIEPEQCKILVLKSSNHFRADFTPLVAQPEHHILIAKAAGPMAADPRELPWRKLQVRAWP